MEFNANITEEVIFSIKKIKPNHPNLFLGNTDFARKSEHKHFNLILDSKPNFQSHTREALMKARRGYWQYKVIISIKGDSRQSLQTACNTSYGLRGYNLS